MPLFRGARVYLAVGVFLALYTALGFVSSQPSTTQLVLRPGATAELELFRLKDSRLRLEAQFPLGGKIAPDLAGFGKVHPSAGEGRFKAVPATRLEVTVSRDGLEPVRYMALPVGGVSAKFATRSLRADDAGEADVWTYFEDATRALSLKAGFNTVRVAVALIDPVLDGETIRLVVQPPLGFVVNSDGAAWLILYFFKEVYLAAYLLIGGLMWALCRRRTRPAGQGRG